MHFALAECFFIAQKEDDILTIEKIKEALFEEIGDTLSRQCGLLSPKDIKALTESYQILYNIEKNEEFIRELEETKPDFSSGVADCDVVPLPFIKN